jgi:hypothetical protein
MPIFTTLEFKLWYDALTSGSTTHGNNTDINNIIDAA